jgi:hypothetical protein
MNDDDTTRLVKTCADCASSKWMGIHTMQQVSHTGGGLHASGWMFFFSGIAGFDVNLYMMKALWSR